MARSKSSLCLPECSGIESRDAAVNAEDDCLAIDHKLLLSDRARRLNNLGIALNPIVAATDNQADAVAIASSRRRYPSYLIW
jgi:hypothetical protein